MLGKRGATTKNARRNGRPRKLGVMGKSTDFERKGQEQAGNAKEVRRSAHLRPKPGADGAGLLVFAAELPIIPMKSTNNNACWRS